jgi:hypothetical protein
MTLSHTQLLAEQPALTRDPPAPRPRARNRLDHSSRD